MAGEPLQILDHAKFRDIHRTFRYIRCPEAMEDIAGVVDVMPEADGLLTYCYVERDHGLKFYILCSGKLQDGSVVTGPDVSEAGARIPFEDARYYPYLAQEALGLDMSRYAEAVGRIGETLELNDRIPRMAVDLELLDRARNIEVPDCVSVVLQQEGLLPELIWARVTGFGRQEIFGEVLNAPGQPGYGLAPGQRIGFRMIDYGEGITLMWDPALTAE